MAQRAWIIRLNWASSTLKFFSLKLDVNKNEQASHILGGNIYETDIWYMIKYVCPEYIKNSHYSIRQITGFKNGQKIWTNILPKKHM